MIFLILGCLVLLVLVTVGRSGKPLRIRREWRFISAATSIATLTGAAYLAFREAWIPAVLLLGVAVSLMGSARVNLRRRAPAPSSLREPMSAEEARSILGVGADASAAEIQAAYTRLMRMAHPDKGGTSGLASQLNAARDRLLPK
ncbi:J domain-containing protein [Phenylobacterium sp.]|uniref:J domain-containing protein n=1 Tax=Phenylobacterium sp. TaxID=1871053 RepID=UPI002DF56D43|nr:DnaJ domain-containing protein [Phenylobacterium sp.]